MPNLGYVPADLWARVAYDYFCSGNSYAQVHGPDKSNADWCAASYAMNLFRQVGVSYNKLPRLDVNLKPLCCWQVGAKSSF